ncbi:MAG: ABC transporter ATP-binding protein [Clostridiales bacterium]|nr:ABC transporter ATP-binding protein [Clostridiales bacterium]
MAQDVIVRLKDLTKTYDLYTGEGDRIRALLGLPAKGLHYSALDGVTQDFLRGEIVGLAGLNGSGKSTLAKIIAGITHPTSGSCQVRGTVNMLAANVGMNDQLTGRENIYYKCMLMGLNRRQIEAVEEEIIDFAEVGVYIDQPLRTYSSGMRSRLGFAISVHVDPEILIVDEALSVGDAAFSEKCLARMQEFRDSGKTIFFVTHAPWQMLHFCDRVMWLHKGRVIGFDDADVMVPSYVEFTREWTRLDQAARDALEPVYADYRDAFQRQQREAWAKKAAERAAAQ